VDVERVDERDPDYQDELDFCLEVDRNLDARASIIRGRYEIVQHAKAAKYLLDALVLRNQPLTEEVICETHRILLQHTEHQNEAGVYRTSDVGATGNAELSIESDDEWAKRKETIRKMKGLPFGAEVAVDRIVKPKFAAKFMRPGSIRPHMASLVKSFNEDMEHTSQAGTIDPVTIASRYCHHFVNVHPFIDGNGRMCRLLLNTILLKFTGVCISVGVEAKEREDWTMLSWRGNKDWIKEDLNDVPLRKQKSYVELTQLVLKKVQQRLGTFKKSMG
jgi:prophage maintenance system killer protein